MGRQPWVIVPNLADPVSQVYMLTADGVSAVVSAGTVLSSMIIFTLLYAALGVVWFLLLRRYIREGVHTQTAEVQTSKRDEDKAAAEAPVLSFAY